MPLLHVCDKCMKLCDKEKYCVTTWSKYPTDIEEKVFCSWECLKEYLESKIPRVEKIEIDIWRTS